MVVRLSASAKLSTAMARKTFSRMSVDVHVSKHYVLKVTELTISGDEKNEEINTSKNPNLLNSAISEDADVHDFVPILARQNLRTRFRRWMNTCTCE